MTDISVTDNCKNPDSYGEICVKCNKCGRFGEQEMTRAEAIKIFREWIDEGFPFDGGYAVEELTDDEKEACNMAISTLECGKMLEVCYDQVKQERDIAIGQLKELGYELGQKIEPCKDAISREAVLSVIDGWYEQNRDTENIEDLIILITYMSSVQPSHKADREFYQSELIKCLEQIRAEIEESRYGLVNDGLDLAIRIIDKRLDKAKKIKEM